MIIIRPLNELQYIIKYSDQFVECSSNVCKFPLIMRINIPRHTPLDSDNERVTYTTSRLPQLPGLIFTF